MKQTKKLYQFTLILKNIDDSTPHLEDTFYEAGCDDALINFRNGTVYLDFDREADSLEKAVISAIQDVERSSLDAIVAYVAPEDLVTESEIAKRLKVKRQTVSLWMKGQRRNNLPFPKPIMKLSNRSPFWKWHEVAEWLFQSHIIDEREIVEEAFFLESVNAVLEERNQTKHRLRQGLLKKLNRFPSFPHSCGK